MDQAQFIEAVKGMSVLELNGLVKALEEEFDVTVPDDLLDPENFENVRCIGALVSRLQDGG